MSATWACPDCGIDNPREVLVCSCGYDWNSSAAPPPSIVLASSAEMYLWLSRAGVVLRILAYLTAVATVLRVFGVVNGFFQAVPEAGEASLVALAFAVVATMIGGVLAFILLRGAEQGCILLLSVHRRVGSIDERVRGRG